MKIASLLERKKLELTLLGRSISWGDVVTVATGALFAQVINFLGIGG